MRVRVPPGVLLIQVRELVGFIRLLEVTQKLDLSPAIVRFLVDGYARKGQPALSWRVDSLGGGRHRMVGDINVERSKIAGVYMPGLHTLLINTDSAGDLRKKVTDVLHEIQHYNQHTRWNSDPGYRRRFTKGRALPPDVEDDPPLLDEIGWVRISNFWEQRYRYRDAPHEIDARRFADKHIDEALDYINRYILGDEE